MDTEGTFAPETTAEARERSDRLGPATQVAVTVTARAMDFDTGEYDRRVYREVL